MVELLSLQDKLSFFPCSFLPDKVSHYLSKEESPFLKERVYGSDLDGVRAEGCKKAVTRGEGGSSLYIKPTM